MMTLLSLRSRPITTTFLLLSFTLLLPSSTICLVSSQQSILPYPAVISPSIWPQPFELTLNTSLPNGGPTLYVDPDNFNVVWDQNCAVRDPLLTQSQTLNQKLFPIVAEEQYDPTMPQLTGLFVHVDCPECPFVIDPNSTVSSETYNLSIAFQPDGSGIVQLYAPTAWGAIWGLESLVQLFSFMDGNYLVYNSSVTVYDIPRFQYRGVMLDTSNHFIPIRILNAILDGMSANKLNVLHWMHRSAVAISIESDVFPELTADPGDGTTGGSYDSTQATYSQADVFALVTYARNRGIHVIIENGGLEGAAAIGRSHPELLACPDLYSLGYGPAPSILSMAFNPLLNETYDFFAAWWHELDQTSTDFVHLGGDLVDYTNCWLTNPNITAYLNKNNYVGQDLQRIFIQNVFTGMLQQQARFPNDPLYPLFSNSQNMMYRASTDTWPDCFPNDLFVNGWANVLFEAKDQTTLQNIAGPNAGFDVIYSGDAWDLTSATTQAKHVLAGLPDIFDDWMDIYIYDIMDGVDATFPSWGQLSRRQLLQQRNDNGHGRNFSAHFGVHRSMFSLLVLGGQVQLYTYQENEYTIQEKLWPRGSAAAERLWSQVNVTSGVDDYTLFRLQSFICTLQRRGLRVGSLRPGFCSTIQRQPRVPTSGSVTVGWPLFGSMIGLSVIGALYVLSVILSTISHLRAGTKAAVTASLNAPLMER